MTLQTSATKRTKRRTGGFRANDRERTEYLRQRQEKVRELARKLGKLNAIERAEILRRIGKVVNIEGHVMSDWNTIFMWYQRNELGALSVVGGFQQWKKAGRIVKKGEKGMWMLFPMFITRKTESGEDAIDPQTGEKDILTRFRVGTVFDISQTNPADSEPCEPSSELPNGEVIEVESEVVA